MFNKISSKLGIPVLLVFIALGMFFGSDGIVKISFDNYEFAEQICLIALMFIMFSGGFDTNWKEAKPVAGKSILLATVGVIITAGLIGVFCYTILHFKFLESFLIGAVLSSTDAASVFSILKSKRLNLKYRTASVLEIESGSNDPFAYMLTVIILSIMKGKTGTGEIFYLIFSQVVYGAVFGILIACVAVYILKKFKFATSGFDIVFVFGTVVLAYALPDSIGGNGYLSVYLMGLILGNAQIKNKQPLVNFFDGITGLMEMLIFFLLGLLAFPSRFPTVLVPSILIALFLTFVARPFAVFSLLTPLKFKFNQNILISWSGVRGAASVVFAIMAVLSGAEIENDIFHMVFCIILLSLAIQGTLISVVARKVKMVDNSVNVLKTFNDYIETVEVQFMKFAITEKHLWKDRAVRDVKIPPESLLVMIIRDNKTIIPNGDTVILEEDIVVLSAPAFQDDNDLVLVEIKIDKNDEWVGKKISELKHKTNWLIVLIKRDETCIIPNGNTEILANDTLVISFVEQMN